MSKRAAAVQLTADNADIDEENVEMPGQFEQATEDQLQKRVIRKAVRRGAVKLGDMDSNGGVSGGIFASLKGSLVGGPKISSQQLSMAAASSSTAAAASKPSPSSQSRSKLSSDHLQQLRSLNISVNDWIGRHVRENPYIDLTPIFRDYEKHMRNIDMKYGRSTSSEDGSQGDSTTGLESSSQEGEESDARVRGDDEQVAMTTDQEESQSNNEESAQESSQPSTSSQESHPEVPTSSAVPPSAEEDDDTSLLKTRAKLFYKKESGFTELGIGTLRVQSSSNKTVRLLLRNDTSLATVILNVRVSSDVPLSTNKNNVLVVCPPNPPLRKGEEPGGGAPVTYLIRVKTADQAEQLLSCIKEHTG